MRCASAQAFSIVFGPSIGSLSESVGDAKHSALKKPSSIPRSAAGCASKPIAETSYCLGWFGNTTSNSHSFDPNTNSTPLAKLAGLGKFMNNEATRAEIVRRLIGTALDLYINNADPFSVYALTNSAAEHAAELARYTGAETFTESAAIVHPHLGLKGVRHIRNQYWTPIKHPRDQRGHKERDLIEALSGFSDAENRHNLLVVWHDYTASGRSMPIEAQVFWAWYILIEPQCFESDFVEKVEIDFQKLLPEFGDRSSKSLLRAMIQKVKAGWQFRICSAVDMRPLVLGSGEYPVDTFLQIGRR